MLYKNIALVDDDADDLMIMKEAFEVNGFSDVTIYTNAEALLNHLYTTTSDVRPDLIVTDLNMPKIGGLELVERLKRSNELAHIPILVWSTSSHSIDRMAALKAGAFAFYTKPLLYDGFLRAVQDLKTRLTGMNSSL